MKIFTLNPFAYLSELKELLKLPGSQVQAAQLHEKGKKGGRKSRIIDSGIVRKKEHDK